MPCKNHFSLPINTSGIKQVKKTRGTFEYARSVLQDSSKANELNRDDPNRNHCKREYQSKLGAVQQIKINVDDSAIRSSPNQSLQPIHQAKAIVRKQLEETNKSRYRQRQVTFIILIECI
jgi:hypothetical protein